MKKLLVLLVLSLALKGEFFRNSTYNVVFDTSTGLMWQDSSPSSYDWAGAINYCVNLTIATHSDWRLPNINEYRSIMDNSRAAAPFVNTKFAYTSTADSYWTSTTINSASTVAYRVVFSTGDVYGDGKGVSHYVQCVRGGN